MIDAPDRIVRLISAKALPGFRLEVRFDDGSSGVVDLSHLVGQGVFARWSEHPAEFERVEIDAKTGAPMWPGGLDVAPDGLHRRILRGEAERG